MRFEDFQWEECYCPHCHKLHRRMVEKDYINNPDVWRKDGKLVILCSQCKLLYYSKRGSDDEY